MKHYALLIVLLSALISLMPVSDILSAEVRESAVAGAFYPSNASLLKKDIQIYLNDVRLDEGKIPKGDMLGFVSPHAGYPYSGGIAAYDYKLLEGKVYDTVVILGPNHRAWGFNGVSIYNDGVYKTPLGEVPIDSEFARAIIKDGGFGFEKRVHAEEHSIEVQVPFLQVVLKEFKIVPIVMGDYSIETCKKLADAIFNNGDERNILIIASCDLSHDKPYDKAVLMDKTGLDYIEKTDAKGLIDAYNNGKTEMCGYGPVLTLMFYVDKFDDVKGILLKSANSGDVVGDKRSRIVGYGAVAFFRTEKTGTSTIKSEKEGENMKNNSEYSESERKELLGLARNSISNYLQTGEETVYKGTTEKFKEKRGVFVTLHKKGQLRGCIGYIEPIKPLQEAVSDNAVNAATRDFRFTPVKQNELKDIDIEVSVLTVPEEIKGPEEFMPGKHGIIIEKGFRSAVFLPQVAPEQGWGTDETLANLCMKAGLSPDEWKKPGMTFYVFTAEVFGEKDG